jgi:hypothetical protein
MQTGLGEYPADFDASKACSYRRNGCAANDDMVTLPAHRWAINFDDGPLPPSKTLYDFLDKEEKRATHFWVSLSLSLLASSSLGTQDRLQCQAALAISETSSRQRRPPRYPYLVSCAFNHLLGRRRHWRAGLVYEDHRRSVGWSQTKVLQAALWGYRQSSSSVSKGKSRL